MDDNLRELLGHGVSFGGVVIPDRRSSAGWGHITSAEACEALVESLLEGTKLNYAGHWSCVHKASTRARKANDMY